MKNLILASLSLLTLLVAISSCNDESLNIDSDSMENIEQPTSTAHTQGKRSCGHAEHMDKLLSDPNFKKLYEKRIQGYKDFAAEHVNSRALCSSPVVIPVAVHFQGANGTATISCLTTQAQEQIAALNADFQGSNSDITNWTGNASSSFPGINFGETCVEFVLADTNHPSGYGLTNGDLAVTRNVTTGDFDSNWSGYLNIFVKNAGGALGYSPLGGSGNGDGVVIDQGAFGINTSCGNIGASAPYNLGRTLTHEVGHYLLLDHIWGGGCSQDDGVADTPDQNSDYGGCPNIGASSCGSTDLHMNYMDYTNDACMYMFTAGQATVQENYVASSLGNLTSNASSVISGGGGGPTCALPSFTNATILSNTSAKVTWDASASATSYQLRYRLSGTTAWTTETTTVAEKTVTGLTAGSTYEYSVRTNCPTGWTAFTAIETFTTSGGGGGPTTCDKPGFSAVEYISATSSKVTWEAMPQAIRYQIRYRKLGTSSWTRKNTTNPVRTLTGLQNGETYQYKIRTRCPSGWTANTAIETFVQSNGTGGGSNNTMTFNLTLDNYGSETTWELVDANFSTVTSGGPFGNNQTGTVISNTLSLPDGCYTLYVDDSYGDGICCTYGYGSFELLDINNSQIGYSNGVFGYYDYIDFCVTNNVATLNRQKKDKKKQNLAPKALVVHSN